MISTPIRFAKLAALYKEITSRSGHVPSYEIFEYIERYRKLRDEIIQGLPDLYGDLPRRVHPLTSGIADDADFLRLIRDMDYVFEVRANSELPSKQPEPVQMAAPRRVF